MFYILKVKNAGDSKGVINNYLVEAENFIHAETIGAKLFGESDDFIAIDNIVKQNIKKIFLNEGSESFWTVKVEFAFVDAKAVKEIFVVQANKIDHALHFINDSIHENEIAIATILEVKKLDVLDTYTQAKLEEQGIISDKRIIEIGEELLNKL